MSTGQVMTLRICLVAAAGAALVLLILGAGPLERALAALGLAACVAALWGLRGRLVVAAEDFHALQAENERLRETLETQSARLVAAGETLKDETLENVWTSQSLEHQVRYANTLINALGEPLLVISKAGNITRVNPAVLKATGYTEAELISSPLHKIFRAAFEDMQTKVDPLPPALKEGRELLERTGYLVNKQGAIIPMHFSLFPLRDQEKVVAGILLLRQPPPKHDPRAAAASRA
ncbi:MAG: PAS domain-containing protein [Verrucomicrobiae bacterium]|nr:PAS domain-containing protein [Verrucomicrobiae bacterium]